MRLLARLALLAALLVAAPARSVVPTTTSTAEYTCNGTLASFTVPFRWLDASHIVVQKVLVSSPYTATTLVLTTDYSVSGTGSTTGGYVTLVDPATDCPTGYKLRVRRIIPLNQGTAFSTQGSFNPKSHENAFDRMAMIAQQLNDGALTTSQYNFANDASDGQVTALGTSAARPLKTRALDFINALDLGADPTGTSDAVSAINSALTLAGSTKCAVLPKGIYRTAGTISIPTGGCLLGYGATLRPDKTPDQHLIRGLGTVGSHLSGVRVSGLYIDGTNKPQWPADGAFPAGVQGGWGQIRFDYTDDLTVSDITWSNVHSCLVMQNVTGFAVSNLVGHDLTDGVVTLFTGTKRGAVSNIQATNASELMDFFNNEDVVVTNVQGTGQSTPEHVNETFDISTSRRISISNVVATGFARCVRVKGEGTGDGSRPAWDDISITSLTCLDQAFDGVNVQDSTTGYTGTARFRLTNSTIKSSVAGSTGIKASASTSGVSDDLLIQNVFVDVDGYDDDDTTDDGHAIGPYFGINAYGWTNARIRDNRVIVRRGGVGMDFSTATGHHGIRVERNVVDAYGGTAGATGASANLAAILLLRVNDAVISHNSVWSELGIGIKASSASADPLKRPIITHNLVRGAGYNGIYVAWAAQAAVDVNRAAEISHNDIRDWGTAASGRPGITIPITTFTGNLEGLNVVGNTLTLPSAASNTQSAISLTSGGALTLTRSRLQDNTSGTSVPSTDYAGQAYFDTTGGANIRSGNFPDTP